MTTYKAIKVGNVRPGDLVVVSGVGGLGHMAVQYAKIFGGTVAAVDITDEKLTLARELGATSSSTPAPTTRPRCCRPTEAPTWRWAWPSMTSRSPRPTPGCAGVRLVLVALPASGTLSIPVFDTVLNGTSVIGSIVGTRADLNEVFALHAAGRTRVSYETRPLAEVNEAIAEVLHGKARARLVLEP